MGCDHLELKLGNKNWFLPNKVKRSPSELLELGWDYPPRGLGGGRLDVLGVELCCHRGTKGVAFSAHKCGGALWSVKQPWG